MIIMGIDQSFTSTGCVVFDGEELLFSNRFVSDPKNSTYHRIHQILTFLKNLQEKYNPDIITFEGLAFSKMGNATRDLAGLLMTCVHYFHFVVNQSVMIIPPKTMKIVFTGNGNASKQDVLAALPPKIQKYLYEDLKILKTKGLYDVCDAYGLAASTSTILNDSVLMKKVEYFVRTQ